MPVSKQMIESYVRGIKHYNGEVPSNEELQKIVPAILSRATSTPALYLYKAGRNRAISEWRRKQRVEEVNQSRRLQVVDRQLILSELQENEAHRKEFLVYLERAYFKGTPPYRDVLRWFYVDGYMYARISQKTGRSIADLYKIRERALTMLREQDIPPDLVECVLEQRAGRYHSEGKTVLTRNAAYTGDWWDRIASISPDEVPSAVNILAGALPGQVFRCFPADCHLVYRWCLLTEGWVIGHKKRSGPIIFPLTRKRSV